ncbi:hypothetical protein [Terrimonas alba]|uniref:hypothetical protein n=1 Tax=Terrimonas alba TaxID=3349636 RepID=UPI0035F3FAA6
MEKKVVPPNHKKDKTPGGAGPKGRIEEDIDDLVHSPDHEIPSDQNEDPDDLVHRMKKRPDPDAESLEDPDDLVHDAPDEEDDER